MHPFAELIATLHDLLRASAAGQDAAIEGALGWTCRNAPANGAILFQRGAAGSFVRTHDAHAAGNEPASPDLRVISHEVVSRLEADWPICLRHPGDAPDKAPEIALLLRHTGSLVIAPMRNGGHLAGFVCFGLTDTGQAISDDTLTLLISASDLIGSALARRESETQRVEATSRLDATLAALPTLLFEMDADGCYTGFSTGPEHLMAAESRSLAGKSLDAVLPPDVAAIAQAALRKVFATGSTRGVRYQLDLADGMHDFELAGALKSVRDAQGRPSAIFLVRDVTEDVQLHQDLLRLGKIVEAMDNLVIIVDVDQAVTWVNPAFENHTGWRLDEIRGKDLGTLVRCAESDPEVARRVGAAIAQQQPFTGEMLNQDRRGNKYWVDFNILPLLDASGALHGYVSVETVITRVKEQEALMAALAAKAAAAQTRLENALMALPDGVVIIDADERVIAVNRAYHEAFPELADIAIPGVGLADLLRAGISKGILSGSGSHEDAEQRLQERLAQYRLPQFMDESQLPDGRWMRRINMRTSDGGCIAVGIDVTARRNHLAALDAANRELVSALADRDAAQQRLVRIVEGAGVGTWELNAAEGSVQIGGRWGEIIGFDTQSMPRLGLADFSALLHPEDRKMFDEIPTAEATLGTETMEREFRMWHRAGHWVWVLSRCRVTQRAPDGTPLVVVGVHVDISERKRLEHDLLASQAYLSQVMDTSVSAVAVLAADGRLSFANREAEHILGLQRSEIIGRAYADPAWRLERATGGPLPDEELPFRLAMAAGGPVRDITFALHWPDGSRHVLSCNAAPLTSGDHEGQVVASFTDITDQLAATARLEDALLRAEEMSRAKSIFLANMSHEIRTPLNGVLGMAEVLDSLVTEPNQKQMVETIRKSGDTLLTVLNGILDMSKIEAGKMELETVPFSPIEILRQVDAIYSVQAEEKGVEFEVLSSAGCDRLRIGDPHRIYQVLNNLLNNAIKFTERGSVQLKVSCRPGKPLVIEVSDTGIGMAEHQVGRAFENFEQGDGSTTRRFGGTGLGLAIVNQLVRLMGGDIVLDSALGRGTKITVTLPLPEAALVTPVATRAAEDPAKRGSLQGVRLLCADDNRVNLLVLKEMLAATGAIITEVENGQQAVDAWVSGMDNGNPFALLLLDIAMPVRDGMSALAEIRATEEAQGLQPVPAIAVTANAMAHQVADYIVGGFDTHLAKPFKQAKLMHALHSLL